MEQKEFNDEVEEQEAEFNVNEEEVNGEDDEDFYEKIEAPKFVDFTKSNDPFRPDDRYWFCLRLGCDRKHEEELDPEEISKKFVLRVMAARSPNIRLRKALNARTASTNMKCPLSAPAKCSKPRVSRLGMDSSLSKKMLDVNTQVRTFPKTSTPTAKSKQVASKYMTTPRNKKCPPNQNSFRSVQNPRPTTVVVPKSRLVAKALVFHSPKKAISLKTSVELHTPVAKLCEGMKKLDITSQKKRVLGHLSKSTKVVGCDPKKSVPLNPSRRQQSPPNGKGGAMFFGQNCKDQKTNSIKIETSKSRQLMTKTCDSMPKKSENDLNGIKINVKHKDGTPMRIMVTEGNEQEEPLEMTKIAGNNECRDCEEQIVVLSELLPSRENVCSQTNSSIGNSDQLDIPRSFDLIEEGVEGSERIEQENIIILCSENDGIHEENLALQGVGKEIEEIDSDDKENAMASDQNRDFNHSNQHPERKVLSTQDTYQNNKKVVHTVHKNLKYGHLTSATTGVQDLKYRKTKLTNPKPFRLRTDERGILKEANNIERNLHAPQKQAAAISKFLGGNSQRTHGNDIKRDSKCMKQSKCSSNVLEYSDKESEKIVNKSTKTSGLKASRAQTCKTPQLYFRLQQDANCLTSLNKHKNNNASQKAENSSRKRRSPSQCQQLVRPQGKVMDSLVTPGKRLAVINETSTKAPKSKSEGKANEGTVTKETKVTASASASARSSSQGRTRPLTVPKEPNFHTYHKPKNCTA